MVCLKHFGFGDNSLALNFDNFVEGSFDLSFLQNGMHQLNNLEGNFAFFMYFCFFLIKILAKYGQNLLTIS